MAKSKKSSAMEIADAQLIGGLRDQINTLSYEIGQMKVNQRTFEMNEVQYKKNTQDYMGQILDLQTKLLASQDRVRDLQNKLLAIRAAAMFRPE